MTKILVETKKKLSKLYRGFQNHIDVGQKKGYVGEIHRYLSYNRVNFIKIT